MNITGFRQEEGTFLKNRREVKIDMSSKTLRHYRGSPLTGLPIRAYLVTMLYTFVQIQSNGTRALGRFKDRRLKHVKQV